MPKPFKPTRTCSIPPDPEIVDIAGKLHVRLRERGKFVNYPLTKDRTKYLRPAKRWYFEVRDASGTLRRMKGFADLKATEQLAAEMERKASRLRSGFTDPAEEHARRPLADHLRDYAAHLEAKAGTTEHVTLTIGRITSLLSGCGFAMPMDVDATRASEWLNTLRRDDALMQLPALDSFTPGEVAKLLGISGAAVRASVKRLNLPASGNGKARTFPRSTVEALVLNRSKGCGPETVNHYIRAVRGFFRWLVKSKRIGSNPLESLTLVNAAVDVRRKRRELTATELRGLFVAARDSTRTYRGLTGSDRFALYLVAVGTGFRANALANLTPADFDLNAHTVTLAARFNKSRRTKVQPLPADVANALREYLDGKPIDSLVWGGTWIERSAEMLRNDLKSAGIAYSVEGPDGPEYADFHSLRHSFLTLGGRSGIDLRTLQELAGHSKPELTARYSHRRLHDLAGAIDRLPNLVPSDGLDAAKRAVPDAVPDAVTGDIEGHQPALMCTIGIVGEVSERLPQVDKRQGPALFSTGPHDSASTRTTGLEPATSGSTVSMLPVVNPIETRNLRHFTPQDAVPDAVNAKTDGGIADTELAAIVAAWPKLPKHIRDAMMALMGIAPRVAVKPASQLDDTLPPGYEAQAQFIKLPD